MRCTIAACVTCNKVTLAAGTSPPRGRVERHEERHPLAAPAKQRSGPSRGASAQRRSQNRVGHLQPNQTVLNAQKRGGHAWTSPGACASTLERSGPPCWRVPNHSLLPRKQGFLHVLVLVLAKPVQSRLRRFLLDQVGKVGITDLKSA